MEKKGFIGEFKEFISKGNVMDMAVGIIIGGAFSAIVTSLVDNVIGPIIGMNVGGVDFSAVTLGQIQIGLFINAVINFLIIAFVLFSIVKAMNKAKALAEKPAEEEAPAPEEPAAPAEDIVLLTEIRDLLAKKDQ